MPDQALALELLDDRIAYRPGETIEGRAVWNVPGNVRRIDVYLCWHTEGRGMEDAAIVETVGFDNPLPTDAQPFRLTAPLGPYSYQGHLICIRWAIELVAQGMNDVGRTEVIISPTREIFSLPSR